MFSQIVITTFAVISQNQLELLIHNSQSCTDGKSDLLGSTCPCQATHLVTLCALPQVNIILIQSHLQALLTPQFIHHLFPVWGVYKSLTHGCLFEMFSGLLNKDSVLRLTASERPEALQASLSMCLAHKEGKWISFLWHGLSCRWPASSWGSKVCLLHCSCKQNPSFEFCPQPPPSSPCPTTTTSITINPAATHLPPPFVLGGSKETVQAH